MSNRAYVSVWCRALGEEILVTTFQKFLEAVPCSSARPGFESVVLRAVDSTQPPLMDMDLRATPATVAELLEMVQELLHADTALETVAHWDAWNYNLAAARWEQTPQRLEISCCGEEYDDGSFSRDGHFCCFVGFEHLFTGHAGLLSPNGRPIELPHDSVEGDFLTAMKDAGALREYRDRTRENVRKLHQWIQVMGRAVTTERYLMWSEGEENLEARLDEIMALR